LRIFGFSFLIAVFWAQIFDYGFLITVFWFQIVDIHMERGRPARISHKLRPLLPQTSTSSTDRGNRIGNLLAESEPP